MDFFQIKSVVKNQGKENKYMEIYPSFLVGRSKDLMVRGKDFYAIWDETKNLWSTDDYDVQRLVDQTLFEYAEKIKDTIQIPISVKTMVDFSTGMWQKYRTFVKELPDSLTRLDDRLTFSNTPIKKTDYVSKKLPYPLEKGSCAAYEELMSTLYAKEEKQKLEWAIGAIVSGDAKYIEKFIVLFGDKGSGKSTFLNIVQKLFQGYYETFDAKSLASNNNQFSTEPFKNNPLVAIQHDGDLSRIEDNTKLNSITSHEPMVMNEKHKPSYTDRVNAFLFMGTNKPVKITDAKSGIIRRLIDVKPTGNKIPNVKYLALMSQIDFELGAIAWHCLQVYKEMGKNYYSGYTPLEMMFQTDVFFNFIEDNYYVFKEQNEISLKQAYEMYKVYCDETLIDYKLARHKFREELKSYFETFYDITRVDGKQVRSYYRGFLCDKFVNSEEQNSNTDKDLSHILVIDEQISDLDDILKDCPAQLANDKGKPVLEWDACKTTLADIDTKKTHYVRPPLNHIFIDFDLKDETGEKSLELNLEAASKWPPTYSELSNGGSGIHLHYIYDGDVDMLSRVYSDGIEVKVSVGKSSIRRRLTKCKNSPIATISSGLPLKGEKMINVKSVEDEKHLRNLINKSLKKEVHPGTKPNIDFIFKILEDAYSSGMKYDVTDLRPKILAFANNSSNQSDYCIKLVSKMPWASEEPSETLEDYQSDELVFFDVEIFPNLFVVVWKKEDGIKVNMINPTPKEIEGLLKFRLIGFNNRRFDNHILYARYIGYDNMQLYNLNQKIISGGRNCFFGEAYSLSYTDIYDFSSKKQSLKKFEIELGIHHMELGLPWDEPVPEALWGKVVEYCGNDVDATEATFKARYSDFVARKILSELSGLTVNDTTHQHTAQIMFGNDKRPQDKFNYVDLSEMFPGYEFKNGVSTYRGEIVGEGGFVYSEPGMYSEAAVMDVESMHPRSAIEMDLFGPYTQRYEDILDARLFIKHKDYDSASKMLDGKLAKYLTNKKEAKNLSNALKLAINQVAGLNCARFDNRFKDPRNKDNIMQKRGALFMIELKHEVQSRGFKVVHIKTDSIKIPNATKEILGFVSDFGKKYGYTFAHEDTYDKFCLVNDAVYIAKVGWSIDEETIGKWTATGTQFAQKYVFKTLFSKEPIVFDDLFETKSVTSALYLDMNETLPEEDHDYHFVGKVGSFCPIKPGCGGGLLCREKDGKYHAATGSKGYRWMETEMVKILNKEDDVDRSYYDRLVDAAVEDISKYGDFEWFVSDDAPEPVKNFMNEPIGFNDTPPWLAPCGRETHCETCVHCLKTNDELNPKRICGRGYDISMITK